MTLTQGIDKSRISASFEDGMLEITVQGGAATAELQHISIKEKHT
jgi:hypothetical protein